MCLPGWVGAIGRLWLHRCKLVQLYLFVVPIFSVWEECIGVISVQIVPITASGLQGLKPMVN